MKTTHARAAAAIRKELKAMGLRCNVTSEAFSMGNAVNVLVWDADQAQRDAINALCRKHQYGKFNGMEDIYELTNRREDIPQAKYVHASFLTTTENQ